jgi:hypothetical protein
LSKALKIAAIVVGVAALIVTGAILVVGPAAAAAGLFTIAGVSVSLAAIGTALTLGATVLSLASGVLTKKPKIPSAGSQLDWLADPTAGEPYVMGKAMVGMDIVHQASWGDKNRWLGIIGAISCAGPIYAYNGFYTDGNLTAFAGGDAVGYYNNFMYLHTQLGAVPEPGFLDMTMSGLQMPDWDAAHKLSGIAAAGVVLVADVDNNKIYAGGTPKMTHLVQGVLGYDARHDDTNGGAGTQRYRNEPTYAYSDNPWVHCGTYAMGRWENGYRVMGPGLAPEKIDWPAFIRASNVADANGWKVSGRVMSTDPKFEVAKALAQAGGGYPIPTVSKLSCLVNTPLVVLDTIEESDVRGSVSAPQMAMRRQRLNGIIPRFRSADHAWEVTPGNTVRNAGYLAADGGNEHTRELDLVLVADQGDGAGKTQAAQLAAYEVANSREKTGIAVELGLVWSQYKTGDCLALNLPSALLFNQKAVVIGRTLNIGRGTVTLEFRTEDDAKHAWALGLTGTTQPPPAVGTAPGGGDVQSATDTATILRNSYPKGMHVVAEDISGSARITISGGGNVLANGNFASSASWVLGAGWTISGGQAHSTASSEPIYQPGVLTAGQQYQFIFDYAISAGAKLRVTNGAPTIGSDIIYISPALVGSGTLPGATPGTFTATGTAFGIEADTNVFSGTLDNAQVIGAVVGATSNFIIDYATTPPQDISVPYGQIGGLAYGTTYYLYADVDDVLDATPTYGATQTYGEAINSSAHPKRIYLNQYITTPAAGAGASAGGSSGGGGYGGGYSGGGGSGPQGGQIP